MGTGIMADTIKIETVKTDSFSMEYFKFGRGKDILVILPGLSVQSVMGLAELVAGAYEPLAYDYTMYMFDRRKDLPEVYSVFDIAHDTAEAVKALGLDDVCLFGASQGGMISAVIAFEHPELVKKLILGSTSARVDDEGFNGISEWIELAKSGDAEALYLAFGEAVYTNEVFEQSKDLLIGAAKTVTKEDLERFVILASGIKGFDIVDKLDGISCPVLLLGSEDDRVLGAEATRIIASKLEGRPGFICHMYNGYGHAAYDMAPDYKERMLEFLKS